MFNKTSLAIAAAASAGVGFLAYCVYFDKKRRSDPDFKRKLLEKRRMASMGTSAKKSSTTNFPDPKNPESFHQFFLQEIQIGEELLAAGQIEEGVEHLCNAVAVCGQPQQLLQLLQQTIPLQIFQMIIQQLPATTMKFRGLTEKTDPSQTGATLSEDVE